MMLLCKGGEDCPVKNMNLCCKGCSELHSCTFVCSDALNGKVCPDEIPDEANALAVFQQKEVAVIQAMTDVLKAKKKLDEQEAAIREQFTAAMDAYGVKTFESDLLKVTFTPATTRKGIDSTKLKKEHPEIFEAYQKETPVKASVRFTLKG